jgi:hypothetical protein
VRHANCEGNKVPLDASLLVTLQETIGLVAEYGQSGRDVVDSLLISLPWVGRGRGRLSPVLADRLHGFFFLLLGG